MGAESANRCVQADSVSLYALHALPASEIPAVEAHLAACTECQGDLKSLAPTIDSLACWPTDVLRPPKSLWQQLTHRIAVESGEPALPAVHSYREPEWEEVAPGISCKILATDIEQDRVSMLVRLAAGAAYPPHRHAGVEELHLLDGELWIEDRKLRPGDYKRGEPGTSDKRVWSKTGCTCVLVTSIRDAIS
jgi:hypothetical protein